MFRRFALWLRSLAGRPDAPDATRLCNRCGRPASVCDFRLSREGGAGETFYCPTCARRALWIPNPTRRGSLEGRTGQAHEVRVQVERIIFSHPSQQVVVLREADGPRRLSFTTGYFEATTLYWTLKDQPSDRPMTHQAWVDTVTSLGAAVQSACVLARREDTYFAEVRLLKDGSSVRIDVRPCDALVVSLRAAVPFLFSEDLLAECATAEPEPA